MNTKALYRAICMFKEARATRVTVEKSGKSWTFPSMEAAAKYFSFISPFSKEQIQGMIENRERYICGFYITYNE